jgi:hypothetical protein
MGTKSPVSEAKKKKQKTATHGYGERDFRGNLHVKPGSVTKKKKKDGGYIGSKDTTAADNYKKTGTPSGWGKKEKD